MSDHKMTRPAENAGRVHVLASEGRISDTDFRRTMADDYERRFREQVGDRLRPGIAKAAIATIRDETMRGGSAAGASAAIDVAKRVAGVDLK